MTMKASSHACCPVCFCQDVTQILEISAMPVLSNVLWKTRQEAQNAARANMHLAYCPECGHVFNQAFQPEKIAYMESYENSLHYSPHFHEYASRKAADLVERYQIYDKDILEIGSGRGDFLRMLVQIGQNRGVGFDPSYPGPEEQDEGVEIRFVQDYYSEKYASYPADFIVCRHVLEHIPEPRGFLGMLRQAIGDRKNTMIFFEVPNVLYTLHDLGIWDLIYEHFSYFSPVSLKEVFCRSGFEVLQITETFGGQFLTVETRPAPENTFAPEQDNQLLSSIACDAHNFGESYREKLTLWRDLLQQFQMANDRVVIWGAGSKGISFLNNFSEGDLIQYAIDINPRKQGMFITGAGQEIVPPGFLTSYQPQVVILMNPNYQAEVERQLQDLGVVAQVLLA